MSVEVDFNQKIPGTKGKLFKDALHEVLRGDEHFATLHADLTDVGSDIGKVQASLSETNDAVATIHADVDALQTAVQELTDLVKAGG